MIETGNIKSDFRLSCSLYELLEIWSMHVREVELSYFDDAGKETTGSGIITNVYVREGVEQIELNSKINIPTKNIIRVNDVSFSDYLKHS